MMIVVIGVVLRLKTWWGVRTVLPPVSALCAALFGAVREHHPWWAWSLLVVAVLAQLILGLIQAADLTEPPTALRKLAAAAAGLFPAVKKIYRAPNASKPAERRGAWDILLSALRSQIVPEGKQQVLRACFYQYDPEADTLTRVWVKERGDARQQAPLQLNSDDGAVFTELKRMMNLHRPEYIRTRWYWWKPQLCQRLGAGVVAVGPALQRVKDDNQVPVGLIMVDAASHRTFGKHPAAGCVAAVGLLLAAEPVHEKAHSP
ncbi:hypothetical protein [Streptomyces sp. XH2]|uniref:hypothetical protein n=1 Tax=Streptomyces sp. XH2 TaxID=3412483 RepID=UPI003C7A7C2E